MTPTVRRGADVDPIKGARSRARVSVVLPWCPLATVDALRYVARVEQSDSVEFIVAGAESVLTPIVQANFPPDFRILTIPGTPTLADLRRQGALVSSGDLIRFVDLVRVDRLIRDGRSSEDRLRSLAPELA